MLRRPRVVLRWVNGRGLFSGGGRISQRVEWGVGVGCGWMGTYLEGWSIFWGGGRRIERFVRTWLFSRWKERFGGGLVMFVNGFLMTPQFQWEECWRKRIRWVFFQISLFVVLICQKVSCVCVWWSVSLLLFIWFRLKWRRQRMRTVTWPLEWLLFLRRYEQVGKCEMVHS